MFKKFLVFFLPVVCLFFSCDIENGDNKAFAKLDIGDEGLQIDQFGNDMEGHIFEISFQGTKRIIDFNKEKIECKTPSVKWINDDFVCIHVWHSSSFSREMYVPFKTDEKFYYLDKSIEKSDSVNSNILYVDTCFKDKIIFNVQNLLTRKTKKIIINVDFDNSIYPFYERLEMKKYLLIFNLSEKENLVFDIGEIY